VSSLRPAVSSMSFLNERLPHLFGWLKTGDHTADRDRSAIQQDAHTVRGSRFLTPTQGGYARGIDGRRSPADAKAPSDRVCFRGICSMLFGNDLTLEKVSKTSSRRACIGITSLVLTSQTKSEIFSNGNQSHRFLVSARSGREAGTVRWLRVGKRCC